MSQYYISYRRKGIRYNYDGLSNYTLEADRDKGSDLLSTAWGIATRKQSAIVRRSKNVISFYYKEGVSSGNPLNPCVARWSNSKGSPPKNGWYSYDLSTEELSDGWTVIGKTSLTDFKFLVGGLYNGTGSNFITWIDDMTVWPTVPDEEFFSGGWTG